MLPLEFKHAWSQTKGKSAIKTGFRIPTIVYVDLKQDEIKWRNVKTEASFYFRFRMMGTLHAWILLLRDNRLSRASLFKVT